MPSNKFTDNKLKVLYSNLLNHHKQLITANKTINQMYDEMYRAVQYDLESSAGSLRHLDQVEKSKAYQAFNAIFYSLPTYTKLSDKQRDEFKPSMPRYEVVFGYVHPNCYHNDYDTLLTWMMLSNLTHQCQYSWNLPIPINSGNYHGHHSTNINNASDGVSTEFVVGVIVFVILAAAAVVALIALYYMLSQLANSIERIWFNEGWLKALLMLATSLGFGAATSSLTLTLGAPLLISLAVTAGFNPVAVVIVATVCLTMIGAGLAMFLTSVIYDAVLKSKNKEAMDPSDHLRFRLTASDEQRLIDKGIDPIKVKCAIVALRTEISKISGDESSLPSYFSRHFFVGETQRQIQQLLDKVRALRSGNIDSVEVGALRFNCKFPEYQSYQQPTMFSVPPKPYEAYQTHVLNQLPENYASAPAYQEFPPPPSYDQAVTQGPAVHAYY